MVELMLDNRIELAGSSPLPDVDEMAERVIGEALAYCAGKLGLGDADAAGEALRQGRPDAWSYYRYALAKGVAAQLGALDDEMRAIYFYDYDATEEDLSFAEGCGSPLIHLIAWAGRKTSALQALVAALDGALARRCGKLLGRETLAHLLDVQVVDDAEVQARTGYGSLLSSLHNRPLPVWQR